MPRLGTTTVTPPALPCGGYPTLRKASPSPKNPFGFPTTGKIPAAAHPTHGHRPLHPSPQTVPRHGGSASSVPSHQQISMATILQSWKEADKLDWKSLFCSCLHHAWQMDRLEASPAPSDQDVYFCLPLFPSFEPSLAVSPTGTLTLLVLFT